ncbi:MULTISPECIES: hypothetical protein [unclassified Stygiolobus]|jgi:hypothetical protein|uniref:hypothetical protein n=1 Tax=unclassified Stygiolobus TaxID=2824672 RepID=UPI00307E90B9
MLSVQGFDFGGFVHCMRTSIGDRYIADALSFLFAIKNHYDVSQFALTSKGVIYEGDTSGVFVGSCEHFNGYVNHFGQGVVLSTAVKVWEYIHGNNQVKFDEVEKEFLNAFLNKKI